VGQTLRGIFEWVADRGGVLGTLALVLISLLLGYALVMFVLSSFRTLFRSLGGRAVAEGQSGSVIAAFVRCGVSVALLVWYVSFAVSEFPDWLGL
jgi:hypothetical protein